MPLPSLSSKRRSRRFAWLPSGTDTYARPGRLCRAVHRPHSSRLSLVVSLTSIPSSVSPLGASYVLLVVEIPLLNELRDFHFGREEESKEIRVDDPTGPRVGQ